MGSKHRWTDDPTTCISMPAHFLRSIPTPMRFDVLVLNAALRQSLVAVRSLGRRELQVAAAGTHRDTPALSSRWWRHGFGFPPEEALGVYVAAIGACVERVGAQGLLAC